MPRRPRANVWELPCRKCEVPVGEPCRDLRGNNRLLYGRRTHRERAQDIKAMREARKNVAIYQPLEVTPVWDNWINTGTATTITYPVRQNDVWHQWTGTTTGTFTTTAYTTQTITWQNWNEWHRPVMRSAEEEQAHQDMLQARREAAAREELAYRQREQQRQEQRAVANARAMDLLTMLVAPGERVDDLDMIQLVGSDGQLYRVEMHRQTVHGNVVRVDEHGCILGRACVAPAMWDREHGALPTADGWVGQYLGLKFDAEESALMRAFIAAAH